MGEQWGELGPRGRRERPDQESRAEGPERCLLRLHRGPGGSRAPEHLRESGGGSRNRRKQGEMEKKEFQNKGEKEKLVGVFASPKMKTRK